MESYKNNRNSIKLDIEAARLSAEQTDNNLPKETYKKLIDDFGLIEAKQNSNMVREKIDTIEDGADEQMLAIDGEKDKLALKTEGVQFIPANGDQKNGNAKVNIGKVVDKGFTGMSKEELMQYANDPFWVRLRWIFFVLFWGLWIAMLVGAILIIIGAPKCAAPQPLAWYKQGPLVVAEPSTPDSVTPELVQSYKSIGTKGVIYELNWNETYRVDAPEIREKLEKLIQHYNDTGINLILDITPNFVYKSDELFVKALNDTAYRSAFIWFDQQKVPTTTWKSKIEITNRTSAWQQVKPQNYVLSQFGADTFDLQMNSQLVKEKFGETLKTLASYGIKGFRLRNAKHFIVNTEKNEESIQIIATGDMTGEYGLYTHTQTTYQPGLGDLLNEYQEIVKNVTDHNGFLSVNEKITNPETFKMTSKDQLGIELPIYGLFPHTLATSSKNKTHQLHKELTNAVNILGNTSWMQWEYDWKALETSTVGLSEYNTFMFLLPGVPVAPVEAFEYRNDSHANVKALEELRASSSYMHGSFESYTDENYTVIAYTRIKSGNPGYFVAYNPTDNDVVRNFANVKGMPEQLTVHMFSENYKIADIVEKGKVQSTAIPISANSVIILTYVPK